MYSISFQEESLLPRERLVRLGAEQLSNQELLSILIRTGNKKENVFQIASRILASVSSLTELRHMTLSELQGISGIGQVKAIELQAMIELGSRISKAENFEGERILSSQKLAKKMQQELSHKKQEHLVALYLNTQNQIIHQQTIFIGSLTRSLAEPREILHSGATRPSRDDDQVTEKIKEACEMMGFVLLDHLIVGGDSYYSYREETDLI